MWQPSSYRNTLYIYGYIPSAIVFNCQALIISQYKKVEDHSTVKSHRPLAKSHLERHTDQSYQSDNEYWHGHNKSPLNTRIGMNVFLFFLLKYIVAENKYKTYKCYFHLLIIEMEWNVCRMSVCSSSYIFHYISSCINGFLSAAMFPGISL